MNNIEAGQRRADTGSMERLTFSVEEAAELIGVGRSAAYEAVRRGEIPVIRIGRRVLVPRSRLFQMLNGSAPETPGTETSAV